MYTTTKRFPPSCRFYIQGNCRAGQDCHFAHILPLSNSPKNNPEANNSGNKPMTQDLKSLQKVIRDIELGQLEKQYSAHIKKTTNEEYNNTLIEMTLPIENKEDLNILVIVPFNYPDTPCTLQIQNIDMTAQTKSDIQAAFEEHKWPQMRHPTLIQQLNWLIAHFNSL